MVRGEFRWFFSAIGVRFPEPEKTFALSGKYPSRPRFEDDETIVEALTAYGERMDRIKALRKQHERIGV